MGVFFPCENMHVVLGSLKNLLITAKQYAMHTASLFFSKWKNKIEDKVGYVASKIFITGFKIFFKNNGWLHVVDESRCLLIKIFSQVMVKYNVKT